MAVTYITSLHRTLTVAVISLIHNPQFTHDVIYSPEKEQTNPSSRKYNGYLLPALHGSGILLATLENTTIISLLPARKKEWLTTVFSFS